MNKNLEPSRLTLRGWATLEDLQKSISTAAEVEDWSKVSALILETVELSCGGFDRNMFWKDVAEAYTVALQLNSPTRKFPIMTSKEKGKTMPWEYEGRSWYFWLNTFAKAYGWSPEEIGNLEIDDAIGLYQEIAIDHQLDNEWDWGLSEMSYEYNKSTKKSHFKPLPRPDWMKGIVDKAKPVRKTRILAKMMPMGEIINLDELGSDTVQSE